jgi:hypothetical protein
VHVVFGVEADENFDPASLRVFISARKCVYSHESEPYEQQYRDYRYFNYAVDNDGTLPPVSIIEIGLPEGKATVHWVEIEIK